jgi:hypothetical protein
VTPEEILDLRDRFAATLGLITKPGLYEHEGDCVAVVVDVGRLLADDPCVCGHALDDHAMDTTATPPDTPCMFRWGLGANQVCPCDRWASDVGPAQERKS